VIEPPFFLFLAGFLACLTAGAALQELLRQAFLREEQPERGSMLVPFAAIALSFIAMLAGGLLIFGIPPVPAFALSAPLVLALAGLVWWRLGAELSGNSVPPF
jgi:ABC-type Na+ efflux pump permease subunit